MSGRRVHTRHGREPGQHHRRDRPRPGQRRKILVHGGRVPQPGKTQRVRLRPGHTDQRHRHRSRLWNLGKRAPLQPEQPILHRRTTGRNRQLFRRERPQHQRPRRQHRLPGRVRGRHRQRVPTRLDQPHPQHRRTTRVQAHLTPGERQPPTRHRLQPRERHRVQRRVQQRRMHPERTRVIDTLRQRDLGEHLTAHTTPRRPQPPEHRPVTKPPGRQPLIQPLQLHRHRPHRRPHPRIKRLGGRDTRSQGADRVQCPWRVVGRPRRPGVDVHVAVARLLRGAHPNLNRHGVVLAEDQGGGERQLLDLVATDLVARADRQLEESGAREDHLSRHHVIAQPRMRGRRHPTGQQYAVGIGQFHGGVQAALAGHADVEEQHVGLQGQRLFHGRQAIPHGGGNLQLGPGTGQLLPQCGGQQVFILGNQGAGGGRVHG